MRAKHFLFLVGLLSACSHVEPSLQGGRLRDTWSNPSTRRYFRVRGIGLPGKETTDEIRRRAESREAALVSARKELLSLIGGLRLTGGITVRDAMVVDSELKLTVDRLVFGAEEHFVEWSDSGACVVTLQVEREVVEKMVAGIKPRDLPEPLPEPTRKFWKSETKREDETPAWTYVSKSTRRNGVGLWSRHTGGFLGLTIPGFAQMTAATHPELEGDLPGHLFFRSLLCVGAAGAMAQISSQEFVKARRSGEQSHRNAGWALVGGVVIAHVAGVWDAVHVLNREVLRFTVVPARHGAALEVAVVF